MPEDYSFGNLARDLLGLLDVVSPGAPVAGIGMSMGTATLLHAAVLAPERFERLVLTAPPTALETRAAQGKAYAALAGLVEERGVAAADDVLRAAPVPAPHRGVQGLPLPVEVSARLLPAVLHGIGAGDLPPRERIARLRLPVLILPWADDPTHPVSTATELASVIPGAALETARTPEELRGWGERAARFLTEDQQRRPTA